MGPQSRLSVAVAVSVRIDFIFFYHTRAAPNSVPYTKYSHMCKIYFAKQMNVQSTQENCIFGFYILESFRLIKFVVFNLLKQHKR